MNDVRSELRVIVTGGRDYHNDAHVFGTLDRLLLQIDARSEPYNSILAATPKSQIIRLILIQGGAPGADRAARDWAKQNDDRVTIITEQADWKKHGKAAGPRRNQAMIDNYKPDLVIAFPGRRGTLNMVGKAHRAHIRVIEAVPLPRPLFATRPAR